MTGLGMMDCKEALVAANGVFEQAIDNLRKQSKKIEKRASRETGQGIVVSKVDEDGNYGLMLELKCESDFVAKTPDFRVLANHLLNVCTDENIQTAEDLLRNNSGKQSIEEGIIKFGENITVGRMVRMQVGENG